MFKTLRAISPLGRSLLRSPSPKSILGHEGSVRIRRVRIVQPFLSPKRIQTASYWVFAIIGGWYTVGFITDREENAVAGQAGKVQPEDSKAHVKDEQREREGQEDDEEEMVMPEVAPEKSWFIPLGRTRKCPQVYYKQSDPEWQTFVKISKDSKQLSELRNQLAGIVGGHTPKELQKVLGKPVKVRRVWLDVEFPEGPPPEYERGGLEFTDDYIAWTARPVHPVNRSRLQKALWPEPILSSIWASYRVFWSLQVAKAKTFLNLQPGDTSRKPASPSSFLELRQLANINGNTKASNTAPPNNISTETKTSALQTSTRSGKEIPIILLPNTDVKSALQVFKLTLARTWKPVWEPPPQGSFVFSGLVELVGPKGCCIFDVLGAYHPAEKRWVSVGASLRKIWTANQGAKGDM